MEYKEKIGEYLTRIQEIRPQQVENILLRQQCGDRRRFGEIAVDLNYIRPAVLEGYLNAEGLPLWKKSRPYRIIRGGSGVSWNEQENLQVSGGLEGKASFKD
jgi:hypothetical protein